MIMAVREQLKSLKEEERRIEDAIWTQTPDDVGDFAVDGEQLSFTVSRSELWKWNSDKLEAIGAKVAVIGNIVKTKSSISRSDYNTIAASLQPSERKELEDALTRKTSKPRIKITNKQ